MWLVVGLGNPGKKYERTRHNVGFDVLESLAERAGGRFRKSWRAQALKVRVSLAGEDVLLVKPQTFMNNSGAAVRALARKQGLRPDQVIVVVDDVDLDVGKLRVRKKGGAGHHNGLKSLISELGSGDFMRVRIGVGDKPEGGDMAEHVLSTVSARERKVLDEAAQKACDAVESILRDGITSTMNEFN